MVTETRKHWSYNNQIKGITYTARECSEGYGGNLSCCHDRKSANISLYGFMAVLGIFTIKNG